MRNNYLQLMSALDALMMELDIRIKICLDVVKNKDWYEKSIKGDYDLWIVKDGQVGVIIDEVEYTLEKHDVVLLSPNQVYTAFGRTDSCSFVFVHFDASVGKNQRALDGLPLAKPVSNQYIENEAAQFLECYEKYRAGEPLSALGVRGTLMMLLWRFMNVQLEKSMQAGTVNSEKNTLFRISKVFSYIEANIAQPIRVEDMAEIAKMSPKYFIAFFKKAVGMTPGQYVLRYKMKKALEYLYEERYSVKEIAAMVGYEDQYTFSKAFKRIYNSAPSNIMEEKTNESD